MACPQTSRVCGGGFFGSHFPPMDALIGNPPYVRRWWQRDVDALQVIAGQVEDADSSHA